MRAGCPGSPRRALAGTRPDRRTAASGSRVPGRSRRPRLRACSACAGAALAGRADPAAARSPGVPSLSYDVALGHLTESFCNTSPWVSCSLSLLVLTLAVSGQGALCNSWLPATAIKARPPPLRRVMNGHGVAAGLGAADDLAVVANRSRGGMQAAERGARVQAAPSIDGMVEALRRHLRSPLPAGAPAYWLRSVACWAMLAGVAITSGAVNDELASRRPGPRSSGA